MSRTRLVGILIAVLVGVAGYIMWRLAIPGTGREAPQTGATAATSSTSGITSKRELGAAPSAAPLNAANAAPSATKGPHKTEQLFLPQGGVRDYLPVLMAKAKGPPPSGEAAYLASAALNACQFIAGLPADEVAKIRAAAGTDPVIAYPDCTGITAEDWAKSDELLRQSAELGFERGQLTYAHRYQQTFTDPLEILKNPERVVEYRNNARRYLESASDSGSWDAMFALSRAFDEGTLAERNPAAAYAYAYAIQHTGGYSTVIGPYMGTLQRHLTGEEVRQGQILGDQLVNRCCSRK